MRITTLHRSWDSEKAVLYAWADSRIRNAETAFHFGEQADSLEFQMQAQTAHALPYLLRWLERGGR